jgi:hypothetical protein
MSASAQVLTMMSLFVVLLYAGLVSSIDIPILPLSFVATFTNPNATLQPQTGTWYYDYINGRQRVDGGNQASCNRIRSAGEYCTTYLMQTGEFYVVFPFTQSCFKSATGVGLLSPAWLRKDNATYVGSERIGNRVCDVWLAMGNAKNYWLQERITHFPCLLDDGGFNWTFSSFQAIPIDASITTIPSYCSNSLPLPK